jgi:hypothetical protein
MKLTHINEKHNPKMVDVGEKAITKRIAVASGEIHMQPSTKKAILEEKTKKGAVLQTAIIAAIMGGYLEGRLMHYRLTPQQVKKLIAIILILLDLKIIYSILHYYHLI